MMGSRKGGKCIRYIMMGSRKGREGWRGTYICSAELVAASKHPFVREGPERGRWVSQTIEDCRSRSY